MQIYLRILFLCVVFTSPGAIAGAQTVGDINRDGRIDLNEARLALQVASGVYGVSNPACQLVGRGPWKPGSGYRECDVVEHAGKLYICTRSHEASAKGGPPDTDVDRWEAISRPTVECWDRDGDQICDPAEDRNHDRRCNAYDCQDDQSLHDLRAAVCRLYRLNQTQPPDFCPALTVFVTNQLYPSNFGGVEEADRICQNIADAAGLKGSYKAWLSDLSHSPAADWAHPEIVYRLVDGTFVANDWNDLTGGKLRHPISRDQNGNQVAAMVWTGTYDNGLKSKECCEQWSSSGSTEQGALGNSSSIENWSYETVQAGCPGYAALYCFEQPLE